MKAVLISMWRLFHALAFYPIMIAIFIWLYVTGAHWGFGFALILAILILDPMWRVLGQNIWNMLNKPKA